MRAVIALDPRRDRLRQRRQMVGGGEAGHGLARLQIVVAVLEPEHLDRFDSA